MHPSPAIPESVSHLNSGQGNMDKSESECLATALELRDLLKEEADILSRFAGTELLWLTPRKESLINEMGWKLDSLRRSKGERFQVSTTLKEILSEIDQLNRSNGVFIQRSLAHWDDFLTVFSPPSYRPGGDTSKPPIHAPRGRGFSREI